MINKLIFLVIFIGITNISASNEIDDDYNQFSVGFGHSETSGFMLNLDLTMIDFLSTKKIFSAKNLISRKGEQAFDINYNEKNKKKGIGFEFKYQKNDTNKTYEADYSSKKYRLGGGYTYLLNEKSWLAFEAGVELLDVDSVESSPIEVKNFVSEHTGSINNVYNKISYSNEKLNDIKNPTSGSKHDLIFEVTLPSSDLRLYTLLYKGLGYYPVSRKLTMLLKGGVSYSDGYRNDPLPFFKNNYVGGIGTVRGYGYNSLGPKENAGTGLNSIGGKLAINATTEIQFPIMENLKGGLFVDTGNVFESKFDSSDMRYSVGLSVVWTSPIGAVLLSYAEPLNEEEGEEIQNFQFTIGADF